MWCWKYVMYLQGAPPRDKHPLTLTSPVEPGENHTHKAVMYQCSTAKCNTARHGTARHSTTQQCTATPHRTAPQRTALSHAMAWHGRPGVEWHRSAKSRRTHHCAEFESEGLVARQQGRLQ